MNDKSEKKINLNQTVSGFELHLTSVDFLQCPNCNGTKVRYIVEGIYECNSCGECFSEDDEDLD